MMNWMRSLRQRSAADAIRGVLLLVFVIGVLGLIAELAILEHVEDAWQWTPFILFAASLLVLAWYGITRSPNAIRAYRVVMLGFVLSALVGAGLHYNGNVEFERELAPDTHGWALVREGLLGGIPLLAPGAMLQLGLLGLAFTIRHPALERDRR